MAKDNPMNPHKQTDEQVRRVVQPPVAKAKVVQARPHDRDDEDQKAYHTARVRVYGEQSTQLAPVIVSLPGDAYVPTVGSDVAVMYGPNEKPWIIGSWYAVNEDREPPSYQPGDRIIGHPDTESYFKIGKDGHIEVRTEGNQRIDLDHQSASVSLTGANQSIGAGNTDVIEFDTVEDDPESLWDANGDFKMTAAAGGLHRITTSVAIPNPGQNNDYTIAIYVNGTEQKRVSQQSAVNDELSLQATTMERLEAGDLVDIRVTNGSGSARDVLADDATTEFDFRRAGI